MLKEEWCFIVLAILTILLTPYKISIYHLENGQAQITNVREIMTEQWQTIFSMPQMYAKSDKISCSPSKDKQSLQSSSHTIDYSMHLNNNFTLLHFNKHRWSEIVAKHLRCHTSLSLLLHFCFGKRKFLTSVLNPSFCLFLLFFKASAVLLTLILFF